MSGHNVPYQLRPNKFVERQLFLDVLDFVRVWNGPSRYIYASMGAKFLEDFKFINERFSIETMISIEIDGNTWKRQQFNRLGFVECRRESSGDFIATMDKLPSGRLIVWLDYAVANKRGQQLGELRQLVSKMASGDVAKITLNANSQSYRRRSAELTRKDFDSYLKDPDSEILCDYDAYVSSLLVPSAENAEQKDRTLTLSDSEYETICIKNLKEQLGEYLPEDQISADDLETSQFANLLLGCIKISALKGVQGTKNHVIPLSAFRYSDGEHQMMTATIVVADDKLAKVIQEDSGFRDWPLSSTKWNSVIEVSVPDLSHKERHHLDGLISTGQDVRKLHEELPFWLDSKEANSISLLESYFRHYRRYPSFVRVRFG